MTEDELDIISSGACPECRQRGFVIGPAASGAVLNLNIECANLACRQRYNIAFYGGRAMMGHRLHIGGPAWPSEPKPDQGQVFIEVGGDR